MLCEGIAKVMNIVLDWNILIQPMLFAYCTKKLRIINVTPYELIYGKNVIMLMDDHRDMTYMERMIDIMEGVSQLRTNAKRAIKKVQQKIEEKFQNEETRFRKGELVLYYKKAEALRHDTKLKPKWKGSYQI